MIHKILNRLQKVRGKNGKWVACCPAHDDKSPSLAVTLKDDGRILMHCFGGCSIGDVLASLGVEVSDLFPDRLPASRDGLKRAFSATDLLKIVHFETLVVLLAANDMSKGKTLSQEDKERLSLAHSRISEAVEYV